MADFIDSEAEESEVSDTLFSPQILRWMHFLKFKI